MQNYKNQKACINCKHSRIAPSVPLYCGINNDYPTTEERYTTEFYEKLREYEISHLVQYSGICDNYKKTD